MDVAFLNVDDLVSQALGDGLGGLEGVLTGSLGDQVDGLVDSSQGRHINCLLSHHTSTADSGRIFSGACIDKSTNENFERVLASEEVNDFECVSDDSDGLGLFTGVSAVELQ